MAPDVEDIHSKMLKPLDIDGLSSLVSWRSGTVPVASQTGVVVHIVKVELQLPGYYTAHPPWESFCQIDERRLWLIVDWCRFCPGPGSVDQLFTLAGTNGSLSSQSASDYCVPQDVL